MQKKTLIRITTVPISLEKLLSGQLEYMGNHYNLIAVSSEKENLEKLGKKINLPVFFVNLTRQITPIKDLLALVKMYFFFKKTKPFIVHSHTPKAGTIGMLAAKLAGVPNRLHTVAGLPLLEIGGKKRKLLDFVEKLTYSCATKVYPNSLGLKDIIIENKYCKANKLKVIGNGSSNGIDTSFFNPELYSFENNQDLKTKLGIDQNDFVFIFVGRLVKDKGINELIAAFSKLQSQHKNIKLLLVGDYETDLDPLSSETLDEITSNSSIISTGFEYDVRPYFAISNALVFPTYREGFPNVVMQAGAMNLPCIVTNINGCNEIIIEGENGIIIPVKNENAIFEAMNDCILKSDAILRMKKNARKMIVSRYEQHVVWKAIFEEYQSFEKNNH
ncbi:glycosyltransferase family 4 protein [Flavobacterium dankookense]|uniref:Glycosyltransferase involved in cell wall biosynthesis n=1 Tax=Flavobacterium dankookense TaxID=706186 RepID=A0A4R6QAP9_9FLAO|nr:glycosyltransferase family 4 protein [Flavobacterium dankookense]TDP59197.1 glycosyltransferase involved in cell wall biosynthesis [Flavobacterium dankookense]